jgi:uncharacterized protein YfiM (DUF2279 family)
MSWLARLVLLLPAAGLILAAGAIVLVCEERPTVDPRPRPDRDNVNWMHEFLAHNDPRRSPPGSVHAILVSESEAGRALSYALNTKFPGWASVDFRPGELMLAVTLMLPDNPLGRYVNLSLDAHQQGDALVVEHWRVGRLPMPTFVANWALRGLYSRLLEDPVLKALRDSLYGLRLSRSRALMLYRWQPELARSLGTEATRWLVGEDDRKRLLAYWGHIAWNSRSRIKASRPALGRLMQPVFQLARERSSSGQAVLENRAAILAMAAYLSGVDLAKLLVPDRPDASPPRYRAYTLNGRDDYAQHFLFSAAITASGGARLADALGLDKELEDSRSGSGFSFTDLAADRAGVRFAGTALGSEEQARRVQAMLAENAAETVFMPDVRDLPEFLSEREFRRRFGAVGTPAYDRLAAEIERRIEALPVHRP